MKELNNKVAVITGAASGIGRGIAESFVAAGMKVVLSDIEHAALDATTKCLRDRGADVYSMVADVSSAKDIANLAERSLEKYGSVDVLCNNAGVYAGSTPSWTSTLDDWNWIVSVNLMGTIHGIQTFLPIMLEQGTEAHIINTASIAGLILQGGALYRMTKTAIVALSESLHQELEHGGKNTKISVLCPAMVDTNLLHSSRNRPSHFPDTGPPARHSKAQRVKQALRLGLKPRAIGDQVTQAILDERFYILPDEEWSTHIMSRAAQIVNGENPSAPTN